MDSLKFLEKSLSDVGFESLTNFSDMGPHPYWFSNKTATDLARAHIRFIYKPKFNAFTVHIGWENLFSQAFVVDAMREMWKPGYDWLIKVNVLSAPCIVTFNIAEYLDWNIGALRCEDSSAIFLKQIKDLMADVVLDKLISVSDPAQLLDCYLRDERPFHWKNCNSALRVAEIAGLVKLLGVRKDEALSRAREFRALINVDMFDLGKGDDWISNLFERIHI